MLNAAIIGLGWWGKTLARAARSGGEIAIVAGATGRRALAEDFAAEQGFDLLDSYEEVLADPRVEAVILATPHLDHEAQMIAAARAGKHIFAEKPFTMTRASAEAAVAAIRTAGVTVGLGHNRRFHPHMADLRARWSGDPAPTPVETRLLSALTAARRGRSMLEVDQAETRTRRGLSQLLRLG